MFDFHYYYVFFRPSISSAPTAKSQKKSISYSIGIDIPLLCCSDGENSASGDSFVVFENDQYMTDDTKTDDSVVFCNETDNGTIVASDALGVSHFQKKIDWRRPGRKHHSRDSTQSSSVLLSREPPMYLYIQMQLCQKESLKEWLNLNQKRVYKDMLDIFSQILDAVEYVHLRKLIHRDLKVMLLSNVKWYNLIPKQLNTFISNKYFYCLFSAQQHFLFVRWTN